MAGDIDSAQVLQERAVAIARRVPGDSARLELALHVANLAWIHENRQQPERALARAREALAIRRSVLDADHPKLLMSLGGLGNLLLRQGLLTEADSILSLHLALIRRVYPEGHSAIAGALHGYATLLSRQGEVDRAEAHYREALRTFRVADGNRSLGVAQTLNDLGLLLQYRRGDAAGAEPLFREAASVFAERRGPEDPWTALVEGNLGVALYSQGRYRDATPVLARAIASLEDRYSATSPVLRIPLVHHGMVLTRLGRVTEAEPLLRRAIDISTAMGDTAQVGRAEVALGIGRFTEGRLPEAETTLVRARTTLAGLGEPDPFLTWADEALVALYTQQGRVADAERYRAEEQPGARR